MSACKSTENYFCLLFLLKSIMTVTKRIIATAPMIISTFCCTPSRIAVITERPSCDSDSDVTLPEVVTSTASLGLSETTEATCSDDFVFELAVDFVDDAALEAAEDVLTAETDDDVWELAGALEAAEEELPLVLLVLPEEVEPLTANAVFAVT
jgi:hypothetical protein